MNRNERNKFLKKLDFILSEEAEYRPIVEEFYEQFKRFKKDYEEMDSQFPVFDEEYAHEYLDRLKIPRTTTCGRDDMFLTFQERLDILVENCRYATSEGLLLPWKMFVDTMQAYYLKEYGEHQDWYKQPTENAEKHLIKMWMEYENIPTKYGLVKIANACLILFHNWKGSSENEDKLKEK